MHVMNQESYCIDTWDRLLDKSVDLFLNKVYVVCNQNNRFNEIVLLSNQKMNVQTDESENITILLINCLIIWTY